MATWPSSSGIGIDGNSDGANGHGNGGKWKQILKAVIADLFT
jgi:hypothetical protein